MNKEQNTMWDKLITPPLTLAEVRARQRRKMFDAMNRVQSIGRSKRTVTDIKFTVLKSR